jgi:O-antigen biosynthesis protein
LLESQLEVPVLFFPQATDPRRFRPVAAQAGLETEVLFVGNSRGQLREAVDWAIKEDLPLTVYGTGWVGRIPNRYLAGEHFPNKDLASLYASAKVVLNDHWPDMKDRGYVSNRVFDVLASGAVAVSDTAAGLGELFDDIVPTFSSPAELSDVVKRLLADPEERKQRGARGAELVHGEHTFPHRAGTMIELIRSLLDGRSKDMVGGVFEYSDAPASRISRAR